MCDFTGEMCDKCVTSQVLLGTTSMLSDRLAEAEDAALQQLVPAGEAEEKLLHLCGSVVQNIALHPDNRTRLYKVSDRE